MDNVPQPLHEKPSMLTRAAVFTLVPVIIVVALPLLLLVVLLLYLIALLHGGRVFLFTWTGKQQAPDIDLPGPHFLDVQPPKALTDESPML